MHIRENRETAMAGMGAPPLAPARVPPAYQGVWARTLLETPAGRDTGTWVRWVQTAGHHGSLGRSAEAASVCDEGPGAPHNVFQTPDRIVQTGLHDRHLAVWERLPASQGPRIALARRDDAGQPTDERLLLCGQYLLHVAPRAGAAPALSFGRVDSARATWTVERASDTALDGCEHPWQLQRLGLDLARVLGAPLLEGAWEVLEWSDA
ncbi:hypothetical protein [Hydrogenophaga sp. T2]|uniref:hypothetical protein n=1 Tax=Hydrogenophaga sp. T2 TaxID=3132823 RepID=UPI003CF1C986